ncbi:MAG: hypothetical protein M1347_03885 [Chloroflexi bacterium]|nr:hypothetical protein [Chloroflexota bacterium]
MTDTTPKEIPSDKNLVYMVAYLCIKDLENLTEQVKVLDRFDLTDAERAQICGSAIQSTRDARQKIKGKR